ESLSRTGELLSATHDIDQLLALIASAAVEAADAEGAALLGENGAVIEVGTLADDAKTFELPIASRESRFGILILYTADLDEFKAANDSHGHAFGDLVLQRFADVLRGTLRDIDLSSRWGGEEFLIVLPGTTLEGAVEAAERIRTALAELELVAGAVTTVMTA